MDFSHDQFLGFSEKFPGKNADGSGTIANLVVLGLWDIDQDFRSSVIDVDRLQNSRAIISDWDFVLSWSGPARFQNFVLKGILVSFLVGAHGGPLGGASGKN